MNKYVHGIIAAMVTSMNPDETLNEAEIRHQVNRQIAAGVDAVFCLGTNGEFYIQSEEEKLEVIRIVVDEVAGRSLFMPVPAAPAPKRPSSCR